MWKLDQYVRIFLDEATAQNFAPTFVITYKN